MKAKLKIFVLTLLAIQGLSLRVFGETDLPLELQHDASTFLDTSMSGFVKNALNMHARQLISNYEAKSEQRMADDIEPIPRDLKQVHKNKKFLINESKKRALSSESKVKKQHKAHLKAVEKEIREKSRIVKEVTKKAKKLSLNVPGKNLKDALKKLVLSENEQTIRNMSKRSLEKSKGNKRKLSDKRNPVHKKKHGKKNKGKHNRKVGKQTRKLSFLDDALKGIKENILPVGIGMAAGGTIARNYIDETHELHRSHLARLKNHLNLRLHMMDETLGMIDEINQKLKIEANKLAVEKDMFDRRFENKAEMIRKIDI